MRALALSLAVFALAPLAARADFIDLYANPNDVGEAKVPRFGRSRVLVLPIEVKQGGAGPKLNREEIVRFYESPDDGELRFPSYFKAVSNGRFAPEATVAPTMFFDRCPDELGGSCDIARGDISVLKSSISVLRTIVDRADRGCWNSRTDCDEKLGIDFSEFDVNGARATKDGYVDGVILVTTMTDVGIALPVYAINDGGDNLAGGTGGPLIADNVKVSLIAMSGSTVHPELVSLHEFGHLLGLADFYQEPLWGDNHPDTEYDGLQASMMGDSDYAGGEFFDAESRYRLGWSDVEVVSGTKRITLKPATQGGNIVKLGIQQKDGRREYYLVEARASSGPYDQVISTRDGRPFAGLAVYKVDWTKGPHSTFIRQLLECLNCDPWHPFIANVQADKRFDIQEGQDFVPEDDLFLEGDTFQDARDTSPFSRDNKVWGANWYDGTPSGISIKVLEVDRVRGWVTAEFTAPEAENLCADVVCASGLSCTAGNCKAPSLVTTNPPPTTKPPAKDTEGEGWGCTSAPLGALALLALVSRRKLYR